MKHMVLTSSFLATSVRYGGLFLLVSCIQQQQTIGKLNQSDKTSSDRPNLLLILTDDQGWSQVSKPMHPEIPESGSRYLSTPNIDRLGDSGIRFTSGYASSPLCTPTRRSILTGTSVARSGTEFKSSYIPAEHLTIPKALKLADPAYLCAHFGKWGGLEMISSPEDCGYDSSDGLTGNNTGGMPRTLGYPDGHLSAPPFFIDNTDPKRTFSVTDSAIAFMRRANEAGRPFFLQVSYYAVHLSIVVREETLNKYEKKGVPDRGYPQAWVAMLDDMDNAIGLLLDALKELGLSDNTYVVLMSDNGGQEEPMPGKSPDRPRLNHPLSGSKGSLLEGGLRVPFMIRGPGIPSGTYSHVPVAGYDLLPTFYELAGGKDPLPEDIDGGSICPVLRDPENGSVKRAVDGIIFHRPGFLSSAIRQGDYKLFITWNPEGGIANRNLYNLANDVVENQENDIINTNIPLAGRLQATLLNHLHSVQAENPVTIIDNLPDKRGVRPPVIR